MLILTLLLLSASSLAHVTRIEKPYYALENADEYFEDFIDTYDKRYASQEEIDIRYEIFKENLEKINRLNADPKQKDAVFGINMFSDLTKEEFSYQYTMPALESMVPPFPVVNTTFPLKEDAPDTFDWRDHGAVTMVKNQGKCGSCWAFSTTGAVEGAYAVKNKKLFSLSEQQLVDCDSANNGCNGGWPTTAIKYFQSKGAEGEDDYKYEATDNTCRYDASKVKVKVTGQLNPDLRDEDKLRQTLSQYGPISIAIATDLFDSYKSGVLNCPDGDINHAVLIVGYGSENGQKYWLIKNSWGRSWGESGYIRVKAGGNPCGMYKYPGTIAQV